MCYFTKESSLMLFIYQTLTLQTKKIEMQSLIDLWSFHGSTSQSLALYFGF